MTSEWQINSLWTACCQNDLTEDRPYQQTRTIAERVPPPPTSGGNDELEPNTADLRVDHYL